MKVVKKIIITLIITLLSILLIFNIYNFINLKILKNDLTTIFGYATLQVVSGSMEPTINVGDIIVINTNVKEYKKGDIVTFKDVNGSYVTHRIMEINDEVMITKGDYEGNSPDEEMPINSLVGKYVFKINAFGNIMKTLRKPFISIMILIIGIIVCYLISTDKTGNPILDEEEKEFEEYLKQKNKKENKKFNKIVKKYNKLKKDIGKKYQKFKKKIKNKFKKEKGKKKKTNKKK